LLSGDGHRVGGDGVDEAENPTSIIEGVSLEQRRKAKSPLMEGGLRFVMEKVKEGGGRF